MKTFISFVKSETVLCCSTVLAIISCFFVTPDTEYFSYIDLRTLTLLFCLMAVMAGFNGAGLFSYCAKRLISSTSSSMGLQAVLTLLCFVFSPFITNDVALISFVPLAITVLGLAGRMDMLPLTVVMQTVAANMGSCLTPIVNPQNIYLYSVSDISFLNFFLLLAPYAGVTLVALSLMLFLTKNQRLIPDKTPKAPINKHKALLHGALFIVSLLGVLKLIPYPVCLVITLIFLVIFDRKIFMKVDYSLLLTFVGFFIFVGNMGRVPLFKEFIENMLLGKEVLFSALASQVISNVPAALLLSGFTENYSALLIGVNIGGLGTLIASMASLISYKYVVAALPERRGKYFLLFTAINLILLVILLGLNLFIELVF